MTEVLSRVETISVRRIASESDLDAAVLRLGASDPALVEHLLAVGGRPPLRLGQPGFAGLASIVVSQQVSTASAAAIFGRLRAALTPADASTFAAGDLCRADDAVLRTVGLSAGKVRTLRALAEAIGCGALPLDALAALPAEEAARRLVAVHGIGPWTAASYLLFSLGHPDVWPAGDLALQEAARVALKLDARPDTAGLDRIGERWRPERAIAARLLWSYYRAIKSRDGTGAMGQ